MTDTDRMLARLREMHDPLAFLKAAHQRAEDIARIIEPGGYAPQTWHTMPSRSLSWLWVYSKSRYLRQPPEEAMREDDEPLAMVRDGRCEHLHIALHDPDAVIRRITAERKLLDLHADAAGKCVECGQGYESGDWGPDFPCATVRLLAESWGWTEAS